MAQPTPYVKSTNFQEEETNAVAGRSTVRTAMVDAELSDIELTLSEVLANLALIQRDDTALQDEIVTTESLSPNVKALFATAGVMPRGAWVTATIYAVGDVVETGTPLVSYICVLSHTSGTFATDRAAGKWMVLGQEPGGAIFTDLTLTTGGVALGTNNTQDLAATANRFRSGYFGTSVFASVSVVTPAVNSASALSIYVNSVNKWFFDNAGNFPLSPLNDLAQDIGDAGHRIRSGYFGTIDSGTTGSLSLKTNNGTVGFTVAHVASGVNNWQAESNVAGSPPTLRVIGSDTNPGGNIAGKGTGTISILTGGGVQFGILDTASATRNITVTGSNGGDPTINVTAGNLAITPAVVLASFIAVGFGGTPASTGAVRVAYANYINSRNSADSNNLQMLGAETVNAITNIVAVGTGAVSSGVYLKARSGGAAPGTSDLPSGTWAVWRDTGGGTTKLYYNNAGAIQSVALA